MRKLFEVTHADEQYIYSAESAYEARRFHDEVVVQPSRGHEPELGEAPALDEFKELPDDQIVAVRDAGPKGETVTRPAGEWAGIECGLVSTTAGY